MKIKELHLLTDNLSETEGFYNTVLNILTHTKTTDKISFLFGTTEIIFKKSKINAEYHIAFDIPNNQVEDAFHWLKSKTNILPITESSKFSEFDLWNAKSFYFYDNNSNLLEFIARFDLENQSEKEFDSSSILYASEIGIVSENVPRLTSKLLNEYPLSIYSKQPPQENFTAIGDETGLLIIVNKNRNWFPTNKKANHFPAKIIFETDINKIYEVSID